jgi:DNA-binding TFAR19-related protein (PDSD5 family)
MARSSTSFPKGKSGNPLGRGKADIDFQQFMRKTLTPKAVKRLEKILMADDDANAVRAIAIIFDRAYGKPVQPLTHDVPQDSTMAEILKNLPRTFGLPKTKL